MISRLVLTSVLWVALTQVSYAAENVYQACSNLVTDYAYHRDQFNAKEFANLFTEVSRGLRRALLYDTKWAPYALFLLMKTTRRVWVMPPFTAHQQVRHQSAALHLWASTMMSSYGRLMVGKSASAFWFRNTHYSVKIKANAPASFELKKAVSYCLLKLLC